MRRGVLRRETRGGGGRVCRGLSLQLGVCGFLGFRVWGLGFRGSGFGA